MLFKCCPQYASKYRKLSSGHRIGKGQFSFQSQRRAMPKNVQITKQQCSFHMPARVCSKSFTLGFISTWTETIQMYKLGLEKAEEPEIKLPTLGGSWRKQRNSRKTISASLTMLSLWLCHYCSVTKSYLTLCDPMDCSMSGFPVIHHLPEFAQTHVH